ncbi:MAG: hypothetical protein AAF598_02555 [Bacteroidota bacterium]
MCTIIIYGIGSQKQRELERRLRTSIKLVKGAVRIRWEDQVEAFVNKGIEQIPAIEINGLVVPYHDLPEGIGLTRLIESNVNNQTPEKL